MNSLEQQVRESAIELQKAWTALQKPPTPTSLPSRCYEHWVKRATLHETLSGTIAIFGVRAEARKIVGEVANATPYYSQQDLNADPTNPKSPNAVKYANHPMEYAVARHLALTALVSVTWSIYDRLANVSGRLAGVAEMSDNPKQNPKTCEDFLGKKDTLGFASHLHIREAYSWPLKVAYKIRNWLVHEGYEEGGTPLFQGERIDDRLTLHSDAITQLQNSCGFAEQDGKINLSCVGKDRECWSRRNLLEILDLYHTEIDTMFSALLKWSVDSFTSQVRVFAARDGK